MFSPLDETNGESMAATTADGSGKGRLNEVRPAPASTTLTRPIAKILLCIEEQDQAQHPHHNTHTTFLTHNPTQILPERVLIQLHRARDLRIADLLGKSDPYAKVSRKSVSDASQGPKLALHDRRHSSPRHFSLLFPLFRITGYSATPPTTTTTSRLNHRCLSTGSSSSNRDANARRSTRCGRRAAAFRQQTSRHSAANC